MNHRSHKPSTLRFASLVLPCVYFYAAGCDRGAEQFEGVVDDCSVTDIVSDAVLFIDRPGDDGLSIFWGTGASDTNQFTIIEMPQAAEDGVDLSFAGAFNFADANGDAVVVEHDAQLVGCGSFGTTTTS